MFAMGGSGNRIANNDRSRSVKEWPRRRRLLRRSHIRSLQPVLAVLLVLLLVHPIAKDSTSIVTLKGRRAQEFVDQLRSELSITTEVQVAVVVYHPLVFSVQPMDSKKDRFLLSMELGFLLTVDDDELRAALAHELGHVWIYIHHPFLQTERLANTIGQRVEARANFEKTYAKLWKYEGTSGVPIDDLLGPSLAGSNVTRPVASETRP
jgi:hypothetical protein